MASNTGLEVRKNFLCESEAWTTADKKNNENVLRRVREKRNNEIRNRQIPLSRTDGSFITSILEMFSRQDENTGDLMKEEWGRTWRLFQTTSLERGNWNNISPLFTNVYQRPESTKYHLLCSKKNSLLLSMAHF
jgi:hypothetical protein